MYDREPPNKITLAVVSLHLSAALYVLVGVAFAVGLPMLVEPEEEAASLVLGLFVLVFCVGMVLPVELVAWGLGRRKFWAWVAGIVIFGVYASSLFLPLGALGLWGLLDEGSRRVFGVGGGGGRPGGYAPRRPDDWEAEYDDPRRPHDRW